MTQVFRSEVDCGVQLLSRLKEEPDDSAFRSSDALRAALP